MAENETEFRFCPVCGGRLDSKIIKENEPPRLVCAMCGFVFYLDPKLVACAIVEKNDAIVLIRRDIEPQKGKWVMPGGYVERGEEPEAAAIRETQEECGVECRIKRLLGIYAYSGYIPVIIVYVAEHVSGDPIPGDETSETRLVSKEQVPWNDLAFQSTKDALKDYYHIRRKQEP